MRIVNVEKLFKFFFYFLTKPYMYIGLWEQNDKEMDAPSVPGSAANGCANVPVPVIQDTWNLEDDMETNMYSSVVTRLDKVRILLVAKLHFIKHFVRLFVNSKRYLEIKWVN